MAIGSTELILNADGSIYHLNLLPEDIASTIITVGDPDRVHEVSQHFDLIEVKKGKREFQTHTGILRGKRISVISTGIGTDNIDIVLNELDALVNVDFSTRTIKKDFTQLTIVRIGTSGAIQPEIEVDSFLLSEFALGFDGLAHFYKRDDHSMDDFIKAFVSHTQWSSKKALPYLVKGNDELAAKFSSNRIRFGLTVTNPGFYGVQGRKIRLEPDDSEFNQKLLSFRHDRLQITNLEMETAGIYTLSKLLGHCAVSLNCILANRTTQTFSERPNEAIENLIEFTLERIIR